MDKKVTKAFKGAKPADILNTVRNVMNGGEDEYDKLNGNYKFGFEEKDGAKYVSLYTEEDTILVTFKRVGDGPILMGMYPKAVPDNDIEYKSIGNLQGGTSRKRRRRTRKTRRRV